MMLTVIIEEASCFLCFELREYLLLSRKVSDLLNVCANLATGFWSGATATADGFVRFFMSCLLKVMD